MARAPASVAARTATTRSDGIVARVRGGGEEIGTRRGFRSGTGARGRLSVIEAIVASAMNRA
jgi:hypothetical protein